MKFSIYCLAASEEKAARRAPITTSLAKRKKQSAGLHSFNLCRTVGEAKQHYTYLII